MKQCLWMVGMGMMAAASLPHAGWAGFVYNLTPYSFITFSFALTALFLALTGQEQTRARAFIAAFAWAFGYFLFGLNWTGNALLVEGNDYAWAWPFAVIGLPFILAPFLAATMATALPLLRHKSQPARVLAFTLAFTLAEYARGHLFTGFPWNLPGMFWAETLPVFQILSLVGIYGLTFLTLFWAVALGLAVTRKISYGSILFISLVISVGAVFLYGLSRLQPPQPDASGQVQIVMVQANIPQSEKWNGDKLVDHFYTHLALSARPDDLDPHIPAMIVWPETALSDPLASSKIATDQIKNLLAPYPPGSVLVTGVLRYEEQGSDIPAFYNSVAVYDQAGQMQIVYDKHHLVPFGEYIPFQNYIPLAPVTRFVGMKPGPGPRTVTLPNLPRFSPLVCYEVIFSGQTVAPESLAPQLLLNLTNDGWYGNSPGPYQHLMEARARAIEENRPLVRVAGTGISALIDPRGRLVKSLPYNQRGNVQATLTFR